MTFDRQKLLRAASSGSRESKTLEFKGRFDVASQMDWCEVVKDIVAIANTDGGVIVFGLENDGTKSNFDCSPVLNCDLADVTNKIFKYTGHQFSDLEFTLIEREVGERYVALVVAPTDVPIIFTKPGSYDIGDGKQKTAFSQGSVYFRHGPKSEPGSREDLSRWRDRTLAVHRRILLQGMRKVVEAPVGHTVAVVPEGVATLAGRAEISARITADPSAPKITISNTDQLFPYRQKEMLAKVNAGRPKVPRINGHDLLCINKCIDVLNKYPNFAHKPHRLASPQYNDSYVEWIRGQALGNPKFFAECRAKYRQLQLASYGRSS